MIEIATVAGLTIALGAVIARFTAFHPLFVAVLMAAIWGALFGLIMAMFAAEAWPLGAGLAFVFGLAPGGIGGFFGWLLKKKAERESNV